MPRTREQGPRSSIFVFHENRCLHRDRRADILPLGLACAPGAVIAWLRPEYCLWQANARFTVHAVPAKAAVPFQYGHQVRFGGHCL
jgi:hypothetical protein